MIERLFGYGMGSTWVSKNPIYINDWGLGDQIRHIRAGVKNSLWDFKL